MENPTLIVESVHIEKSIEFTHGDRIVNKICIDDSIKKYFTSDQFYIEYSDTLYCDESILYIPVVAALLPIAWLVSAKIYVKSIDARFLESMNKLQSVLHGIYPNAPFGAEIIADKVVNNTTNSIGVGMPFSGGLDSTYTLAKVCDENPYLFIILGLTTRTWQKEYFRKVFSFYEDWTSKNNFQLMKADTNIREILDMNAIDNDFCMKYLNVENVYGPLQLPILPPAAIAPLSVGRFNHVYISGTTSEETEVERYNLSQIPEVDECNTWADITTTHIGHIPREDKILLATKFADETNLSIIHACIKTDTWSKIFPEYVNCNICVKCLWTIIEMLLCGKDPNKYGYVVDESTLRVMKIVLSREPIYPPYIKCYFQPLQQKSLDKVLGIDGAIEFLKWFQSVELLRGK